ncbi:hypothetical protein A8L34_03875 [Bacillus sp. FJAT-27264]|uniref:glycerophosphodiester phosphodiesterase n=1 Tax=Paenibacillus sp. (strain DSM 101736 / FJAT-27264) TaxID=1850362 RepID=UPI000807E7D8|nr:glycerophosphodiester phosphodiesterase [Bacillus sp. FJAT-27264]OBZ18708.1 hypothetical protein A8L34_03875 [Bacillus sp. FJAT-27264]
MTGHFPWITAHTGCMDTLDNTLPSVEEGIRLGADIIEDDIRVTRDGIAILAHDDIWQSVDGRTIQISALSFKELQSVEVIVDYAGKTGKMTFSTLEDLLLLIKGSGRMANLDLKVDEAIDAAAALVHKHDMLGQIFLSGCGAERALLAQQRYPELKKLLNADSEHFLNRSYEEALKQTLSDALAAACFGINIYHEFVTPELIEQAKANGLKVYVWTVNDVSLMEHYAALGVDSLTTRAVEGLVQLKKSVQQ